MKVDLGKKVGVFWPAGFYVFKKYTLPFLLILMLGLFTVDAIFILQDMADNSSNILEAFLFYSPALGKGMVRLLCVAVLYHLVFSFVSICVVYQNGLAFFSAELPLFHRVVWDDLVFQKPLRLWTFFGPISYFQVVSKDGKKRKIYFRTSDPEKFLKTVLQYAGDEHSLVQALKEHQEKEKSV